ncbi:MAG: DnaD domain protein [Clostridia bacterium]|nr:DnaD domain protein [Clostridia bacterium]
MAKLEGRAQMICSFSKEFSAAAYTGVENSFIREYLAEAPGDAVKVYLYGLYLCGNPAPADADIGLKEFAEALKLTEEKVADCFLYWEEFGLVSVIGKNPFAVKYLPQSAAVYAKPRKFKAEKYSDFSKGLQALLPDRMISTNEYSEYFSVMETYSIQPDAMLMIAKYCADKKGSDISYRYVSKVAKDFGNRGITTVEKVEQELSSYILRTGEIAKILKALSIRHQPDIDDLNYYKKWTRELGFEPESIVFAAKTLKKSSMPKLDELLLELYSTKSFSREEIAGYAANKQAAYDFAVRFNRALSVYVDVLDAEVDTYVNKWFSYGYSEDALLLVANSLFRDGKNSLQDADDLIERLRGRGIVDLSSVNDYFEEEKKTDEFLRKMLLTCGVNRRPNPWDKENLLVWKSWNFSEDMILEAAKISAGKSFPTAYMNGVLSNWKNKGVFSPEAASETSESFALTQEEYNREYARRRTVAVAKAQKNLENAQEIPEFSKVYERLFGIEKDLAFAEIAGNFDAMEKLNAEKSELNDRAKNLLSAVGLNMSDLSPKYACDKCKDTGYVGTHRCDCFDKKVD